MKNRTRKVIATVCILALTLVFSVLLAGCNKTWENNIEYVVEENGEITIAGYTDSTLIHEITIPDDKAEKISTVADAIAFIEANK